MMPVRWLSIAIIGDEDLNSGMRLAGVRRYYTIKDEQNSREETRKALTELLVEPDVGIIAVQEKYLEYVDDLIAKHKQDRKMTPVIIGVPSKYDTKYQDVTAYYKAYIKGFIGFDVEI